MSAADAGANAANVEEKSEETTPPTVVCALATLISHNLSREQHVILANRPNARSRACALKLAPVASTTVVDVDGVVLRATRARGKQRATACHWWPRLAKQG